MKMKLFLALPILLLTNCTNNNQQSLSVQGNSSTMKALLAIALFLLGFSGFGQDTTNYRIDTTKVNSYPEIAGTTKVERPIFRTYPSFSRNPEPLNRFIPKNWKILDSVVSDLNGDKIPDLSLVLQHKDTVYEIRPGGWEWENTPRILLLLFKEKTNNLYRLSLQNNHIISRPGTGKQGGDPFDKLIVKNRILTLGGEMGGKYDFRFQDGNFYLISAWTNGRTRAKERYSADGAYNYDTFYYYKIDFLKSKVKIQKNLMNDDDRDLMEKEIYIRKRPLLRLKDIKEFDEKIIFKGFIK